MGSNVGGRPTKLTPELVEQARAYLDEHDISIGTLLPTIEGLAYRLHIHRDTLYAWEKTPATQDEKNGRSSDPTPDEMAQLYKSFSDILEDMRQLQANKLIQNGILGRYNPVISKMMLSKYGYVEKTAVDGEQKIIIETRRHRADDND